MGGDPLEELERRLGHRFADRSLLDIARSHDPAGSPERRHAHRRLAFLGDLVWTLGVGLHLYRVLPGASVAELTRIRARLVGATGLGRLAEWYGLPSALHLGPGQRAAGDRTEVRILAEAFEAVVGALYLDGGFRAVAPLVREAARCRLALTESGMDPKSALQILLQSQGRGIPRYRIVSRQGPAHAPSFTVQALSGDFPLAEGRGPNRRQAEREAAAEALKRLTHNP